MKTEMKTDEKQPKVVELSFREFLHLLISRRPLKRVHHHRRDWSLRGALVDPETGTIYARRVQTASV